MKTFLIFVILGALHYCTGLSLYLNAAIYRLVGTAPVIATSPDGQTTTSILGPSAPIPDWVPRLSDEVVLSASQSFTKPTGTKSGTLDVVTRLPLGEIRKYYLERLEVAGFVMKDEGLGSIDGRTARVLSVAGTLRGQRREADERVFVNIRGEEGFVLRTRAVQIVWRDGAFGAPN